ncbi:hypothetical protein QFZ37_002907 [Chryseobacterium ginsenosidimutans]|uniref:hypothetical protein n=1 Tax=Chryseobacterium ginsenosidimutans TaxID=687846 RepID=UPI00278A819B|nr:hypothetical protein [Chryseobacterium ginsenosidimutans]MDQ0594538.1 hypothetical protein [Chryseobacterium ginsenosidimutans]
MEKQKPPNWWLDYNSLKYNRSDDYHVAHLESLLNALSIVNHYYVWEKFYPDNQLNSASLHLSRFPT